MLASAGRRYLLSMVNSTHAMAQQCFTGSPQLAVLQPSISQPLTQSLSTSTVQQQSSTQDPTQQQQQQGQQELPPPAAVPAADVQTNKAEGTPPLHSKQQAAVKQKPLAAVMGARKVNPAAFGGSKGPTAKREGVVHVNSTMNNTHLVLTDRENKVETWVSGGTVGYKNANKASPMAAELAAKELARRALDKGFHSVVVKLKGMGKNKQFAVQSLAASGLTVTQLWDVTPIPYNGCRLPRRRRV